jgi:hypothetical protein
LRIWKYGRGLHDYVQICINIFKILKILGFVIRLPGLRYQSSNIAEGVERDSKKDFARFLQYSKGSCGELRTQIYIGIDIDYIEPAVGKKWTQETKDLSAMLVGLSKSLRKIN